MIKTTLEDARNQLPDLFKAALRGEEVFITERDETEQHVIQLVVVPAERGGAEFGSGKGLFRMAENFDDPLPDFDEYQ